MALSRLAVFTIHCCCVSIQSSTDAHLALNSEQQKNQMWIYVRLGITEIA